MSFSSTTSPGAQPSTSPGAAAIAIADEQRVIDLSVRAKLIPQDKAPRAEAIRDTGFSAALAAVR